MLEVENHRLDVLLRLRVARGPCSAAHRRFAQTRSRATSRAIESVASTASAILRRLGLVAAKRLVVATAAAAAPARHTATAAALARLGAELPGLGGGIVGLHVERVQLRLRRLRLMRGWGGDHRSVLRRPSVAAAGPVARAHAVGARGGWLCRREER